MSLAIRHHVGGLSRGAEAPARVTKPTAPAAALETQRGGGGARHALVDALSEALRNIALPAAGSGAQAVDAAETAGDLPAAGAAPSGSELKHAQRQFTHELFSLLRPAAGDGPGQGRGYAWGRTSPADLAERLDALVQRLQGADAAAPATPSVPALPDPPQGQNAAEVTPPADGAAVATDAAASATAPTSADAGTPPDTATSVTTTASPLLDAFERLAGTAGAADEPASSSDRLVSLLRHLADTLRGDTGGDVRASGSLLDVVA